MKILFKSLAKLTIIGIVCSICLYALSSFTSTKSYASYDIQQVEKYGQRFYILTDNGRAVNFIRVTR